MVVAPSLDIKEDLGDVFDDSGDTFSIMNEKNVSFVLSPPSSCAKSVSLLVMVSSGPRNKVNRDRWRKEVKDLTKEVMLIFLVSRGATVVDNKRLSEEHAAHGDILSSTLVDGHRKLGYKILTGYVWAGINCGQVQAVAKTDDNVYLDLTKLLQLLQQKKLSENTIACGSGTPHRNMKTLRSAGPHMTGNWSTSKEELEADIMPDFCCGFLYLTTPGVGTALVQAALIMYGDTEVVQIEDSLITGVLRERLPGVTIDSLETGLLARLWLNVFSLCPWLTITKLTFSNNLVISKTSSRNNVQYVGSVTAPQVWRYYICLHLEVGLDWVQQAVPGIVPHFIWDICKR